MNVDQAARDVAYQRTAARGVGGIVDAWAAAAGGWRFVVAWRSFGESRLNGVDGATSAFR
jgi:hypothetical protein